MNMQISDAITQDDIRAGAITYEENQNFLNSLRGRTQLTLGFADIERQAQRNARAARLARRRKDRQKRFVF